MKTKRKGKKFIRKRKRKSKRFYEKTLRLIGINANGLKSKLSTFKKVIMDLQPALFFLQETKYKTAGRFEIENFQIFELVRKSREGGGASPGLHKRAETCLVKGRK